MFDLLRDLLRPLCRLRAAFLVLVFATLAACSAILPPDDASPRETALDVMLKYEAVQIVAETAITSPLLAEQPEAKMVIRSATQVATAAVFAYDDVTRGCVRNAAGEIELVPGLLCQPNEALALLPVAVDAIAGLGVVLGAYGVNPPGAAPTVFEVPT